MKIETDRVELVGGVRGGETLGSPIALSIANRDHANWLDRMSPAPLPVAARAADPPAPRPRRPRRRAEARPARSARRARARQRARDGRANRGRRRVPQAARRRSGIDVFAHVVAIGPVEAPPVDGSPPTSCARRVARERSRLRRSPRPRRDMKRRHPRRRARRRHAGRRLRGRRHGRPAGPRQPRAVGPQARRPPGAGAHEHPGHQGRRDRRGFGAARARGSSVHDPIHYDAAARRFTRPTNRAGGLEGGITNGDARRLPRGDEAHRDAEEGARQRRRPHEGALRGRVRAERRVRRRRRERRRRGDGVHRPGRRAAREVRRRLDARAGAQRRRLPAAARRSTETMRPVVLSGFMATGKSTVGPRLAARLGVPFVDTDAEIERDAGKTRPRALARRRARPRSARARARSSSGCSRTATPRVIAFGGGTVTVAAHAPPRARPRARRHAHGLARDDRRRACTGRRGRARTSRWAATPSRARESLLEERADGLRRVPPVALERRARRRRRSSTPSSRSSSATRCSCPLGTRSYTIDVCDDDPSRLTDAVARCAPSSVVLVTDSNVQRARGDAIEAALRPLAVRADARDASAGRGAQDPRQRLDHLGRGARRAASTATRCVVAVGRRRRRATSPGSRRRACCAACASCRCRRRSSRWSTPRSAARRASITRPARTSSAPSTSPARSWPTSRTSTRCRRASCAPGSPRSSKIALADGRGAPRAARARRRAPSRAATTRRCCRSCARPSRRRSASSATTSARRAPRALLNLGHTVGHALEAHGGYARWLHGEAVALGHVAEMRATARLGWTPAALRRPRAALLRRPGPADARRFSRARRVLALRRRRQEARRGPSGCRSSPRPGESRLERVRSMRCEGALLPT